MDARQCAIIPSRKRCSSRWRSVMSRNAGPSSQICRDSIEISVLWQCFSNQCMVDAPLAAQPPLFALRMRPSDWHRERCAVCDHCGLARRQLLQAVGRNVKGQSKHSATSLAWCLTCTIASCCCFSRSACVRCQSSDWRARRSACCPDDFSW